ncbi:hypothetical protein B0A66_15840 [Flavobacterium hercynium]|uniref:Uncharacterized protein n=1 Tax=Flavobacterium hercynium TaxID=387094 RepID=A0A226H0M0_9FLAO|nr:hypothetical protein B0A66_15840 [Flavobacterium hercynium]
MIDWEEREVKEDEKFLKKNFIFFLPFRNKFSTFAPALRDKRNKKEIHVRRHIELTAVLTEMLKQKNKSNRIERFEKNR